jgi:hypothetical protein
MHLARRVLFLAKVSRPRQVQLRAFSIKRNSKISINSPVRFCRHCSSCMSAGMGDRTWPQNLCRCNGTKGCTGTDQILPQKRLHLWSNYAYQVAPGEQASRNNLSNLKSAPFGPSWSRLRWFLQKAHCIPAYSGLLVSALQFEDQGRCLLLR